MTTASVYDDGLVSEKQSENAYAIVSDCSVSCDDGVYDDAQGACWRTDDVCADGWKSADDVVNGYESAARYAR